MILAWILDVSQYSELCVWRARFEVSRRLGRYCVLSSILGNMFLGWRRVAFLHDFVYACRRLDVLSQMVAFEFGETMRVVDFMILS